MNKAKRKSTSLAVGIMILALCVIVGTTFALWRYNVEGFSAVNFGKVEIAGNESIDRIIQLKDAVPGDVLFTELSFSKSADSEPMYVRAHIEYTTPSTVPQTKLTDANIKAIFDAGNGLIAGETYILEDATGVSAECPVYQYGNDKYVKFEMTQANSCSLDFSYFTRFHGVQYYKIEPVRWIVIGDGNGNELSQDFDMYTTSLDSVTVVSEKILIQHMFNLRELHQTSAGTSASNDWAS